MTVSSGVLLRRFRLVAGFTQEELAEWSVNSVHSVREPERDESRPPRAALDLGDEERTTLLGQRTSRQMRTSPDMLTRSVRSAGTRPDSGEPEIGKTRLLEPAGS